MNIPELTQKIIAFRDAREWKKFHNPKDVSLSLVLEATEVMEHFQWKNQDEMEKYVIEKQEEIADELADVLYWILLMCNDLNIDIVDATIKKIDKNERKYPVNKSKGNHSKYDKL